MREARLANHSGSEDNKQSPPSVRVWRDETCCNPWGRDTMSLRSSKARCLRAWRCLISSSCSSISEQSCIHSFSRPVRCCNHLQLPPILQYRVSKYLSDLGIGTTSLADAALLHSRFSISLACKGPPMRLLGCMLSRCSLQTPGEDRSDFQA